MGISAPFQSAGKFRVWPALTGFKQVLIAYLAAISYLDKLVQPTYTSSTQIRPKATPRACEATLDTLTSRGRVNIEVKISIQGPIMTSLL